MGSGFLWEVRAVHREDGSVRAVRNQNAKRQNTTNLGVMVARHRAMGMLTLRDFAKQIGVGAATIMRIEHGYVPEATTLIRLLNWMMEKPS